MELKQILKDLKVSGIKLKDIAEKTGMNIHTLYSITSGRKISKEKETYLISLIYSIYKKELVRLEFINDFR